MKWDQHIIGLTKWSVKDTPVTETALTLSSLAQNLKPDITEIKRAASILCNGMTELRILSGRKVLSGYYDDYDRLTQDAATQNPNADGVYFIPNIIQHDLLARSANHLKEAKNTTADNDILARRWLPIDLDPKRPAGISSTEAEHQAALNMASNTADWLVGYGIPRDAVIVGDSGNGAHVLVRLEDIPNDETNRNVITRVLQVLNENLSDKTVIVDLTTFNAARIWKLYGTVARKGDSTTERPHRLSKLLVVPENIVSVPFDILETMATLAHETTRQQALPRLSFNLETWMPDHGIVVKRKEPYRGGYRYILEQCPFNAEHTGTSCAIIQYEDGMITFNCKHNSCAGKTWSEVRELKEPGYWQHRGNSVIKNTSLYCPESHPVKSERDNSVTNSVTEPLISTEIVTPEKIEEWVKSTSGWFSYEELDRDIGIKSPKDKDRRRQIIHRLKAEGKLESHQRDNKLYRYVNVAVRVIDFKSAALRSTLAIRYPFGIERYFKTYPGNIVVVAGAADAGKTAFLLNFVRLNMNDFSVFYQSSEMGKDELASRLELFEGISLDEWNFIAEERSHDFHDVIRPDCINIIDYMELSGDFYMVAEYLRAIHDKLASGIAIVALQKKTGADAGRGGDFSLEKPRLYLNVDKGKIKIRKAKNWVDPKTNPNGLVLDFKTVGGCKFIVTQDWHKEVTD
jgi:hypothetical protein